MNQVMISGSFDDLRSPQIRFIEECSKLGALHVLLWSDRVVEQLLGNAPKFSLAERQYLLESLRYVFRVHVMDEEGDPSTVFGRDGFRPDIWAVAQNEDSPTKSAFCDEQGMVYQIVSDASLAGFPAPPALKPTGRKKVLVTGCFDWFHSGHVRFFEEVSELGDLYVVVGHDENIRLLKGDGHPLFKEAERRYVAGSIRFVTQALVSSGTGWMDAEPEIAVIKPHMYAVNEDGDKQEKREFCKMHGLEYVVLKRTPKEGLTKRSSTDLRGF